MSTQERGPIDYVKFLWTIDEQVFQDTILRRLNGILDRLDDTPGLVKNTKLTPLGAERKGLRRYVFEAWGVAADEIAKLVPITWFNNLRRADFKEMLPLLSDDEYRSALNALYFRKAPLNKSTIDSKPRHKAGDRRDVGGLGILYGSRKSDTHGIIIQRGDDLRYREYRAQNKAAQKLGRLVAAMAETAGAANGYHHLCAQMSLDARFWWGKLLGSPSMITFIELAKQGADITRAADNNSFFAETEEEAEYWQALTPEEQEAEQGRAVEPTPKGWWVDDPTTDGDVMWEPNPAHPDFPSS